MNEEQCRDMSISELQIILKDYIISHTIPNGYVGKVEYLDIYKKNMEYLK